MECKDIRTYTFSSSDQLLFDTNIWLTLYGPRPKHDAKTRAYSAALLRVLSVNSKIYIDALILSEFINRLARFHFNLARQSGDTREFKQYRKSSDFKPIAEVIATISRKVLRHCEKVESGFASVDTTEVLDSYEKDGLDFNDQMLAYICKEKGLKLVTHDSDFSHFDISILTVNQTLLNAS